MKLITKEIENKAKSIGCQDGKGLKAIVIAKYFSIANQWRWYATEYDPETKLFFGYVCGWEHEWGSFSLEEFENVNRSKSFPIIERDSHIQYKPLKELLIGDGYTQYK
jgi:hypothetical protein